MNCWQKNLESAIENGIGEGPWINLTVTKISYLVKKPCSKVNLGDKCGIRLLHTAYQYAHWTKPESPTLFKVQCSVMNVRDNLLRIQDEDLPRIDVGLDS